MQTQTSDLEAGAHRRLNVGSGHYPLRYFTNLDADESVPADIHESVPPLPFDDEALDEIWACHFLEHLVYEDGQAFLEECYRCLVPGGKLGVVVPDTREIMKRWLAGTIDAVEIPYGEWWNVADLDHVCRVFLFSPDQTHPHKWAYDAGTLQRAMRFAGFGEFEEIDRYRDPRIVQGAWWQCGWFGYKQ